MTYAEQLLKIEEDKQNLLKKSRESLFNHYFCFVNIEPIEFLSPTSKDLLQCGSKLTFEIVAVDNSDNRQVQSIDFSVTLNIGKNNELVSSCSASCHLKTINNKGIFLIQNFADLNETQKTEFLKSISTYYERVQRDEDSYVQRLNIANIIDYFKSEPYASLSDFIESINQRVPTILENHLSSFVSEKTRIKFNNSEEDKTYQLSVEDKHKLIETIQSNFENSVKDCLYKIKKEGNYQQDWERLHNITVDFFNAKEFVSYKHKKSL